MFSEFACDFDRGDETTKIFIRRNGSEIAPKELRLPPNSKLADLLEKAGKALNIDEPQIAFYSNGLACHDIEHIEDDEVIYISRGEPFRPAASTLGANSRKVGNYDLREKLGQGGFGTVIKGVHSETGEFAAVKFVPKSSFRQISDLQRVFQEIQALRNLHHPNVIRILDVADHPENVCFIMEFAPGGELRQYVERRLFLEEEEAKQFFKQICRAIHYVHSKKIIHRDLKLENILLDSQNRCKIVDFGLSDYVSSKERTVTDAGTEAYLAPEVHNGSSGAADPYKIDVWGLGVILYALAHGKLPFSRPDIETCQRLVSDGGPQYREDLSKEYMRLVSAMLTPNPTKRYSMDDVSLDQWVTSDRFAEMPEGSSSLVSVEAGGCLKAFSELRSPDGKEDAVTAIFRGSTHDTAHDGRHIRWEDVDGAGRVANSARSGGANHHGRTPAGARNNITPRGAPGRSGSQAKASTSATERSSSSGRRGASLGPSPSVPAKAAEGRQRRSDGPILRGARH